MRSVGGKAKGGGGYRDVKFEARIDELKVYYDRHRTFRIARKTHKGLYFWVQTVLKAWAEGRLPAWKQRRLMETGLSARQYAANLFRLSPQVAEKVQRMQRTKKRLTDMLKLKKELALLKLLKKKKQLRGGA